MNLAPAASTSDRPRILDTSRRWRIAVIAGDPDHWTGLGLYEGLVTSAVYVAGYHARL